MVVVVADKTTSKLIKFHVRIIFSHHCCWKPRCRSIHWLVTTTIVWQGTLRVLLVLLHDFPEFLCDYHYAFCDVIPPNCIQMRNLVLSAFPRNMRLPDPFTPNLKVDMLSDIAHPPRIMTDFANMIQPVSFQKVGLSLMLSLNSWCSGQRFWLLLPCCLGHCLGRGQEWEIMQWVSMTIECLVLNLPWLILS